MAYNTPECFGSYCSRGKCMSCNVNTMKRCRSYTEYVEEINRIQTETHNDIKRLAKVTDTMMKKIKRVFS